MTHPLSTKTILIAGSTGFIGSSLTRRLSSQGARVRATYHAKSPRHRDPNVEYLHTDLTNMDDCRRAAAGCQLVYMCAARGSAAGTLASGATTRLAGNLVMNTWMLEAAHQEGVEQFLWLGSSIAYPPTGDRPVREEEILDGQPFAKYHASGWEKRIMEVLCQIYGDAMTTVVLRPTSVYGPGDNFDLKTCNVVPALVRKVLERWDPLEVWGTGDDVRDLVYIDDVIDAMVLAAHLKKHTTLNIGAGSGHSIKDILNALCQIEGFTPRLQFDPTKPSAIPVRRVNVEKAKDVLGFSPSVSLCDGLSRTLKWCRDTDYGSRPEDRT